jgi:hypothetical protein
LTAAIALLALGCGGRAGGDIIDVHKVDWNSVTLPGIVCGASRPIRLHPHRSSFGSSGEAVIDSARWSGLGYSQVHVDTAGPPRAYGDLNGDGRDEAALDVNCNNGGGTAGGVLGRAVVIFAATVGAPRVIGVVTPQKQPPGTSTLLSVTIRPRMIVANESWHEKSVFPRPCCVFGWATTTWSYAHGALRPVRIVATTVGAWSKTGNLLPVETVVARNLGPG